MKFKKRYVVDLPAQQAQCESNYHRLLRLFGCTSERPMHALKEQTHHQFLLGHGMSADTLAQLSVVEQTKYTTLVHIVQLNALQSQSSCVKNHSKSVTSIFPSQDQTCVYEANVRLYHDVGLAEIVSCQHHQQFDARYEYPNESMHQINEKVQINTFLGEFLAHCLAHGRVSGCVIDLELINKKYA